MAIKTSVAVKNARLDAIETAIGVSAKLKIFTGSPPLACSDADSGDMLALLNLASDWLETASLGSKTKKGTWSDSAANASGIAGHFRIYASDGTTCHLQGTITETDDGGDMTVDNVNLVAGRTITITYFALTDGN